MNNLILVISDSPEDAAALKGALQCAHDGPFLVLWERHLSAAFACLELRDVDAVLVDLILPDSDGIQTFVRLFEAYPEIPILTLSSLNDESLAVEAVRLGAQGYLSKGHFASYLVPQSLRNIIQRKAVEQALHVERERAAITLNSISDGVVGTDMNGLVEYMNAAAEQITGWSRDDARGRPISTVMPLINAKTRIPLQNPLEVAMSSSVPLPKDTLILQRGGREIGIEDSTAPIRDTRGRTVGAVMVFHDATEAQILSTKMTHLAQHDVLTNLPNRFLLNDRISQGIIQARRNHFSIAVLFLDLDKFKHINDSLGHEMGDNLLQSVADRLRACVRASDTVSRLGGDEFVILLSEVNHVGDVALAAEKMNAALAAPHHIDGHELNISSSIGISVFPDDGDTPGVLLKNADTAMYQAKQHGRNNCQFFTAAMNVRAVERQVIESNLRRAQERDELVLFYQPKINLTTGSITGVEALLRWIHPTWGAMLPERFVGVAEESGLIVPIGRWVLREACLQSMRWKAEGLAPGAMAVNVSSLEFRHKDFLEGVRAVLDETGMEPGSLQLEITESVLMHDIDSSVKLFKQLKQMGIELAVDDFGTGYSSLSYLLQFPVDVLKIDQSFVKNVATTPNSGYIVSAVIGMGRSLNQLVIAEGIEEESQLEFLRQHDCEEGQGYLFSRPVSAKDCGAVLARGIILGI
jgi:diguanylate cyclase (GGDEF)-like protein/PAS domain S-box-containing protein